jgi:hypothetical protein
MAHSARASSSSDGSDLEHCDQFEPRQRESSVGNFDSRNESPTIAQFHAARLHEKLAQVGHLPSKWMTKDELYYMAKIADSGHWPWERADILTPTPPEDRTDMLTPTPPSSLETSSPKILIQSSSRRRTKLQRPNPLHRIEPPLNSPRRHNLRSKQSSTKRASGGIQKQQILQKKHSMVTRSRCGGRCYRRQGACRDGG